MISSENCIGVIARYNEDLNWTLEEPFNKFKYIVYNKGENDNFNKTHVLDTIQLPNVGRCDHTYLYHIVTNYSNLHPITIFLPGSITIEHKKIRAVYILNYILKHKMACVVTQDINKNIYHHFQDFTLSNWNSSEPNNNRLNPENKLYPAKIRPFGAWYKYYFKNLNVEYSILFGVFSFHRNDIIQHTVNRYIQLLNCLSTHSNPETGHYMERAWSSICYPHRYTKVTFYNSNNDISVTSKSNKTIFRNRMGGVISYA
tara:strand:+ start:1130 stop:1903 length:774 start_codon:yes stop_codon:yes gene_type:complete